MGCDWGSGAGDWLLVVGRSWMVAKCGKLEVNGSELSAEGRQLVKTLCISMRLPGDCGRRSRASYEEPGARFSPPAQVV